MGLNKKEQALKSCSSRNSKYYLVAAQGPQKKSRQRGVYKTTNGEKLKKFWKQSMDRSNRYLIDPEIRMFYLATWTGIELQCLYGRSSSGIKSVDGGETGKII